jgi:hypothetical protein
MDMGAPRLDRLGGMGRAAGQGMNRSRARIIHALKLPQLFLTGKPASASAAFACAMLTSPK